MSAPKKDLKNIQKIGIIAGGGSVPAIVYDSCSARGVDPLIVALRGNADAASLKNRNHIWSRIGAGGGIIRELHHRGIEALVLIGSIKKPNPLTLRPDFKTAKFLTAHSLKLGDNSLLSALRIFLEQEGFTVYGAHEIEPTLMTPRGVLGKIQPSEENEADIKMGIKLSQNLGHRDIGQSVIVKDGEVIAEEGHKGTDAMIDHYGCAGGILVKTCKPQQDPDLDMPTIGPETVRRAAKKGLRGIVLHAGKSLFVEREEAIKIADDSNIFITGIEV